MVSLQINTLDSGEIDYDHLTARLEANKDRPAILNVNIGTTVKGAVDDLDRILTILESTGALMLSGSVVPSSVPARVRLSVRSGCSQ